MAIQDPYALCACGSGKKYKFCCMEKDREAARLAKEEQDKKDADEAKLKPASEVIKPHERGARGSTGVNQKIFRGSQRGS